MKNIRKITIIVALALTCVGCTKPGSNQYEIISPIADHIKYGFELDTDFYKKCVIAGGIPVVSSNKVDDNALREAAWLIENMMDYRRDVLKVIADRKIHLTVMAHNEYTSDVPEHSDFFEPKDKNFWDRRARGLGATDQSKTFSCGQENLLCFKGDPYWNENILIHEFAHVIHLMALNYMDPTFDNRLKKAYDQARAQGKWAPPCYAGSNHREYWAEGVQDWFNNNRENDNQHNHVDTRVELIEYDPGLAAIIAEVFGDKPRQYVKPADRDANQRKHLVNYDVQNAPEFAWPERLINATEKTN